MGLDLRGTVSLDGSGFEAGLNKIESAVGHIKGMVAQAFGAAAIEEAIRRTIEYGAEISRTAERLGIGTDAFQELAFAARQTGADIEDLTRFIEKLNAARIDPKKASSFLKLGISDASRMTLPVEEIISRLNANMRNRSPQELIGPLIQVGGRGAGVMMDMLRSNLEDMAEAAHNAAQVMDKQTIAQLHLLEQQFKLVATAIAVQLGPVLVWLGREFVGIANYLRGAFAFAKSLIGADTRIAKAFDPSVSAFFSKEKWRAMGGLISDAFKPGAKEKIVDAIKEAYLEGGGVFMTEQDKFEAMLAKLGKGKEFEPDFVSVMNQDKAKKIRGAAPPEDALIRVGNFLGNSQSAMSRIGERTNVLLEAANSELRAMRQILAVMGTGSFEVPP